MGCVSSKQNVSVTPTLDHSSALRDSAGLRSVSGRSRVGPSDSEKKKFGGGGGEAVGADYGESGRASSTCGNESLSFRLGNLQKYVEGEQVAAGWPAWLSAVAGEAIQGWVPLSADAFEKLEKVGQGTYSSVFKARELETGRSVALKKVRFDNFEPESVRFMAREILILRRLDHPNIIKLEGIVTSRLSCSIYLVFEYMEHDLSGLSSCLDIKFTEPQVKCYMKQLLSGLDHCHSRGIMHRDIKGSNLLVNNEGILKVADFGLANFSILSHRQPLTSRVVTLWYRPPELLLGATDYGPSVDLWSVACVFAEVLLGKPLLQGRTEVEQLHKIFKLCGSPPEDYWKKSKLPHATLFKPQQRYESSLLDTCKDLPRAAVNLIETLLSVEPYKRGTAGDALSSEYFTSKPYACEPSSLPKYAPSKEIDAKHHEEVGRKKASGRVHGLETARKGIKKPNGCSKLAPAEKLPPQVHQETNRTKINSNVALFPSEEDKMSAREPPLPSIDQREEPPLHVKNASQGDVPYSGPLQVPVSSGFAWVKKHRDDAASSVRTHSRSSSKISLNGLETLSALYDKNNCELKKHEYEGVHLHSRGRDYYEAVKRTVERQWSQFDCPDSFDASEAYHSQDLSLSLYQKEMEAKAHNMMDQEDKVEFSGPLLSQTHRIDELLERHERRIRQAVRRSWFQRGRKLGK